MAIIGKRPERKLVIDPGFPIGVRYGNRVVAQFQTMLEAEEYVARDGYAVRRKGPKVIVHQRGVDVREFPDARSAWAWISGQMK